jgi:hypothetical protein
MPFSLSMSSDSESEMPPEDEEATTAMSYESPSQIRKTMQPVDTNLSTLGIMLKLVRMPIYRSLVFGGCIFVQLNDFIERNTWCSVVSVIFRCFWCSVLGNKFYDHLSQGSSRNRTVFVYFYSGNWSNCRCNVWRLDH